MGCPCCFCAISFLCNMLPSVQRTYVAGFFPVDLTLLPNHSTHLQRLCCPNACCKSSRPPGNQAKQDTGLLHGHRQLCCLDCRIPCNQWTWISVGSHACHSKTIQEPAHSQHHPWAAAQLPLLSPTGASHCKHACSQQPDIFGS